MAQEEQNVLKRKSNLYKRGFRISEQMFLIETWHWFVKNGKLIILNKPHISHAKYKKLLSRICLYLSSRDCKVWIKTCKSLNWNRL